MPTALLVVPALACAGSWLGAGALVPSRTFRGESLLLELVTRLMVGALAWSVGLYGLGRVGLFRRPVLIGLTLVLLLPGAWQLARSLRRRPSSELRLARPYRLLAALTVLALVLDLVGASTPPTSADALTYHFALPSAWLDRGWIGDPFWYWPAFNPFGVEMLFGQGLALGGGPAAGAVGALITAVATAAVYGLGRELGGRSRAAGVFAASLFALQGIVTWAATGGFVETGLAAYTVLAAWLAVRAVATGRLGAAALAGTAAGAAAGTKYLGLLSGGIVVAALTVAAARDRRWSFGVVPAACAVAAAAPWYLKNLLVARNPVYPLYGGGRFWTSDAENAVAGLRSAYGVGSSVLRLPLLPIDLLVHGGRFDRGQYVGTAVFLFALAGLLTSRRVAVRWLFLGSAVYVVAWWESSPQARFLLPALGILAAVGGVGAERIARAGRRSAAAVVLVLVAAAAAWLVSSAALTRQLLPVAVGLESTPHFAQRLTGTYDALHSVSSSTTGTLALAGYNGLYYYPGRVLYLGAGEFAPDVPRGDFLARLRREDVRFVLAQNPSQVPNLDPIRSCLRHVEDVPARFVTSRARGTSEPITLELFKVACR